MDEFELGLSMEMTHGGHRFVQRNRRRDHSRSHQELNVL